MSSNRWRPSRRAVVGTTAASIATALAGCAGETDPADSGEQQLDAPAEFPEDESCAVCGMVTPEYPEWNAQLVNEDGERVYFCSSGCLLAYYVDPEQFDGEEKPVENVWVTDYETGELIDGRECHYVRVTDPDHVDDIMMMNPTPFADRDGAEAFIDELNGEFDAGYDHDADIITFDDFDMELAMLYRERFLAGEGDHEGHGDHDH